MVVSGPHTIAVISAPSYTQVVEFPGSVRKIFFDRGYRDWECWPWIYPFIRLEEGISGNELQPQTIVVCGAHSDPRGWPLRSRTFDNWKMPSIVLRFSLDYTIFRMPWWCCWLKNGSLAKNTTQANWEVVTSGPALEIHDPCSIYYSYCLQHSL